MNNLTFVTGRLTSDGEIVYYESGKCKATFTLAVDSYADKEKFTTFIRCEVWDKKAEFVSEYFKKGSAVSVYGELTKREYEGKTYYTLNCREANFTNCQQIILGNIASVGENTFKLQNSLNSEEIEVRYFGNKIEKSENTKIYVLNVYFKDYKPYYVLSSIA